MTDVELLFSDTYEAVDIGKVEKVIEVEPMPKEVPSSPSPEREKELQPA